MSVDINGLTNDPTPDGAADYVMTYDASATANKKVLLNNLPGGGGGGGVSSLNGLTGAVTLYSPPQGRVSLACSGVGIAVMTSSVTAATTYCYLPSSGNIVPIYDGSKLVPFTFSLLTQTTTDTTRAPAAVTTNSNYDICVGLSGGVPALFRSPAWSSNTSRGTGSNTAEQTIINGFRVNAQNITNGPVAQRCTYVATIHSNASSTIDFQIGGSGSGGVAGSMGVWNMYNRSLAVMNAVDTGAQYSYFGALRQARASSGNQNSLVIGVIEDAVDATYVTRVDTPATATAFCIVGIGVNSTSTITSQRGFSQTVAANVSIQTPSLPLSFYPTLGFTTIAALEWGVSSGCAFNGDSANTLITKVWN
ncbi:hypothetical protein [Tardiphaga robiniae]|uniref:hypothetical protein n=1 Tax=Tardiphaga robiniae TaxID=943830 RepID=UPI0015868CBF|nr:hypothetical protein [Tardiphaga robiniae]NUU39632.1 hypothetical protein [Tardiphaga robiniae]